MLDKHFHDNASAHRIANDMCLPNLKMIHEPRDVIYHLDPILCRFMRLVTFPVSATIESDGFVIFGEMGYQGSPHIQIARKTMNQNHRLALPTTMYLILTPLELEN